MCFGTSAAAPSSLLASLATGQRGVGGRMLGSNLNTISLCGIEKQRRDRNLVEKTKQHEKQLQFPPISTRTTYNKERLTKTFTAWYNKHLMARVKKSNSPVVDHHASNMGVVAKKLQIVKRECLSLIFNLAALKISEI